MQSNHQRNDSGTNKNRHKHKNKKQRNRSLTTSQQNKQNKKRKHHDLEDTTNNNNLSTSKKIASPPKKKQKISKRPSKKPTISHITPNSHITITFANINGTIDAIILPKQNVLAMNSDILLENKGKLSIKTSDPIQNDITPQIPIDIKILKTPNIKTIHPRNSFRMGTSLFYCSDEERLFWSFPLRNTRRVSCQHYCCAVSKIVTRSVGIHSNKCNGNHSEHTPCIYAVCNGKPPKGIIPAKLFANYQYFQHSAKTELLVPKDPNDEKFKKVPNTNTNSTMYQNIKVITLHNTATGPPPLSPMDDSMNSYNSIKHKYIQNKAQPIKIKQENCGNIKELQTDPIKSETDSKRRRAQTTNNNKNPFQQNVQIDLKALSEKKQKLRANASQITSSSSTNTEPESHDYSELLLHSTSSVLRDADEPGTGTGTGTGMRTEPVSNRKKCKQLLMSGGFDEVISFLKPLIPPQDFPGFPAAKCKSNSRKKKQETSGNKKLNECRLLMATALYYRDYVGNGENDSSAALHFCNLIVSNCTKNEGDTQYYEARKIRGLIHKKLRNYKAAVHDFEFICYNNPYHKTWRDQLYANRGKSNFLENKVMSAKNHHRPPPPQPMRHRLLQQGRPNMYQANIPPNIANMPPPFHTNKLRLNEIITTHHHHNHNINVLQNNNYFPPNPPIFPVMHRPLLSNQTLDPDALNILAQSMVDTAMNSGAKSPAMDIANPNAPIIFIPPIMDRKSNSNSGRNTPTNSAQNANKANKLGINLSDFHIPQLQHENKSKPNGNASLLDVQYSELSISQLPVLPKGFPERSTSNTSFEGLIALAHAASNEYDKKQEKKEKKEQVMNAEDLLKDLGGFTALKRKTTREELLGEQCMDVNSPNDDKVVSIDESKDSNDNNNLSPNFANMAGSLHKTVSTTPEPLERIRSDALVRNSSQ